MSVPILRTERLTLRPPEDGDASDIANALNDLEVARWLVSVPHPYEIGDARDFLAKRHARDGDWRVWLICPHGGPGVGIIGLEGEFGYWLGRDHWGQGYGTEASRAVIDWHFAEDQAAASLEAGHFLGNARSRQVLCKLGFQDDGAPFERDTLISGRVKSQPMTLDRARWASMTARSTANP